MNAAFRIAWRNLRRHPQRTVLMTAIVAFGSLVILVLFGIVDGFVGSMTAARVAEDQGSFQIRTIAYGADPGLENALSPEQVSRAEAALEGMRLAGIAPRLEVGAMLRSAYGTDGVALRGIDPLAERSVTRLPEMVVAGRYLTGSGEILLSAALAAELDVRVGERVVVVVSGSAGMRSRAFVAVGLFSPTVVEMERVATASIKDVRELTGTRGATALAVGLPHGASPERAVAEARRRLAAHLDLVVADYFTLNPLARVMISGSTIKLIPFVIMISLLAGFGVANTTFYSVIERTREFGMMTAVGMSRKMLAGIVLLESTFVGVMGFAIGGGIGYGGLLYLGKNGLDFSSFVRDVSGALGMPTVIYAAASGWYWMAAFSVVVFTALVAAWYPARRAHRLEPVTAIREG
ncbi:FtsX-like permease family protein [Candidatus Bipolaricaulota bacterium]|nr:FtsX-like permease family protein [Candidatus Bipolaricaulota bacterium]